LPGRPGAAAAGLALLLAPLLVGCALGELRCVAARETVARGLTNPRGLVRDPDGALLVAEAGTREHGGRVVRIEGRAPQPLIPGLPHMRHGRDEDVGPSALAFRRGELYVAQGENAPPLGSALLRLRPEGGVERVADFEAYEVQYNPDGGHVESNPFGLLYDQTADRFFATDAAANALLSIRPDGAIDHLASWENRVPTGLALAPVAATAREGGGLYVALFSPFPHERGAGQVVRVRPEERGRAEPVADGLTMPIAVAFGAGDELYVLEFAASYRVGQGFRPASGRLLRLRDGAPEPIADRLPYPTALLPEPDGSLLVSTGGAIVRPGSGAVVRLRPCPSS
jgi:hypothetical protein